MKLCAEKPDEGMRTRTSRRMFLAHIVLNGVKCTALVDTECSYELILSPDRLKKFNLNSKLLKQKSKVKLGNNTTQAITHETSACISINGFAATMYGVLLPLGDMFDCVLGLPYLERL